MWFWASDFRLFCWLVGRKYISYWRGGVHSHGAITKKIFSPNAGNIMWSHWLRITIFSILIMCVNSDLVILHYIMSVSLPHQNVNCMAILIILINANVTVESLWLSYSITVIVTITVFHYDYQIIVTAISCSLSILSWSP